MKLTINSFSGFVPTVKKYVKRKETIKILKDKVDSIEVIGARPLFLPDDRFEYFKRNNICLPKPKVIRIYIGNEITGVMDKYDGAEMPPDVLETYIKFKNEVLLKVLALLDLFEKDPYCDSNGITCS